jgi:target of EGR1 protein 1
MKTPTSAYISSFNDVTEANLQDHCLVIATKLKDATHVAIDLEFTGLCRSRQKDMNHRYVSMKRVVENGSMLSLGLSIFGKSKKTEKEEQNQTTEVPPPFAESYVCDNFNFLTKKKSSYVIDNDTKKFLTEHGFRFDRLEQEGIPFTPPNIRGNNHHSQTPSETGTYTLQTVWNQIMTEIAHYKVPLVVHNGLHDLLYIYSSFINPLPERWTEFVSRLPIHFPGGIFDTKYLVEAGPFGDASFLTYVFAKSDRDRQDRFTNSTQAKPYFEVVVNPAVYGKKSNNIPIEETKDDSKKRKASTDLEQVTIKKKKREYCYEYAVSIMLVAINVFIDKSSYPTIDVRLLRPC